jgi:hypothetical protein
MEFQKAALAGSRKRGPQVVNAELPARAQGAPEDANRGGHVGNEEDAEHANDRVEA